MRNQFAFRFIRTQHQVNKCKLTRVIIFFAG